jgi:hypothetical protein
MDDDKPDNPWPWAPPDTTPEYVIPSAAWSVCFECKSAIVAGDGMVWEGRNLHVQCHLNRQNRRKKGR